MASVLLAKKETFVPLDVFLDSSFEDYPTSYVMAMEAGQVLLLNVSLHREQLLLQDQDQDYLVQGLQGFLGDLLLLQADHLFLLFLDVLLEDDVVNIQQTSLP